MRGLGYLPWAIRHATYLRENGLGKRARDRKIFAVDASSRRAGEQRVEAWSGIPSFLSERHSLDVPG